MRREHVHPRTVAGLLLALGILIPAPSWAAVERWGLFETFLPGPDTGNPYVEVSFSARFTQAGRSLTVPGFYDGRGRYGLRFSPPTSGHWTYVTQSNLPALDGRRGTVDAGVPTGDNHGPIQVFETHYLRYADDTPYHQFGTTCYAWIHQTEALQAQTLRTLAQAPFNKIRFCIFPKHYAYNSNEPQRFAFQQRPDGRIDFDRPDPAFWHHLERRILDLQRLGIQADLILWHPYDHWGFKTMTDTQDDRYLRYCIARLAGYRNVWWSLANEYDFMSDLDNRHRGIKTLDDWDRFFRILRDEDPYGRMRGIHNGAIWYDHTQPWVTHASLQTSDMQRGVEFRRRYGKPVIYDECRYEGDIPQGWGHLTAREMTQRFWLGTLSGCYVGHGETYLDPNDVLWWSKGGVLHGRSPARIQWLKDLMAAAPPFHELKPRGDTQGRFLLAQPGRYYLLYCTAGQTQSLDLPPGQPFKVDRLDPWAMTVRPVGSARDRFTATAPESDQAFRLVPYAPGEALRPELTLRASVTTGVPPLSADFTATATATGTVTWDFDDGGTAAGPAVTHRFTAAGVYTVTATLSNDRGPCAESRVLILVDREADEALVHVGARTADVPALHLVRTRRDAATGALAFGPGPDWGRAETRGDVSEILGGLRSFTITAWLQPKSLDVGSGGNRILFCLQRSAAGIDLVHLADGRLRLAVNEWPDRVHNDSRPGALVAGRWTRFAVTYDATRSENQVRWYLSEPSATFDPHALLRLDQRQTYPAGPVAREVGPLAIGNFNQTMQSYGWDRQFRGTIRDLRVYGSRISSRGARDMGTQQ